MGKSYSEACNACGKDIHPPVSPPRDVFGNVMLLVADCIWIERYPVRDSCVHPLTNYVCTGCAGELDAWLRKAGAR